MRNKNLKVLLVSILAVIFTQPVMAVRKGAVKNVCAESLRPTSRLRAQDVDHVEQTDAVYSPDGTMVYGRGYEGGAGGHYYDSPVDSRDSEGNNFDNGL